MRPVVTPSGTVTVNDVVDATVTIAVCPLNLTVFAPIVAPKFTPVIVTDAPVIPDAGAKLAMVGSFELGIVNDAILPSDPYVAPAFIVPRNATFCP